MFLQWNFPLQLQRLEKGVFICPLLATHSKNTALSALAYLRSANMVPPSHREDQLHHAFSSYTRAGFCLMYLVKRNFVLFVQYCLHSTI